VRRKKLTISAALLVIVIIGASIAIYGNFEPTFKGQTVTGWALKYLKRNGSGTMTHHFFLLFTEWTAASQQRNPELDALVKIGLPAIPPLVKLRDHGPGTAFQRFYWRLWDHIPNAVQHRLVAPHGVDSVDWKMDMTQLICIVLLCHRDESNAPQFTRSLFEESLKVAQSNDFHNGIHFYLLAATGINDAAAEKYLLKQMEPKDVIFVFETGSAAASLHRPSDAIYKVLGSWLAPSTPQNQRSIAFEALGYLARQNPVVEEQLWQRFLEANPGDQEHWRIGLGNGYYPKDLSARMESTIHDWLQSTDLSKESLREQWRGFYKYRDKLF
jgi:hypothetical protein